LGDLIYSDIPLFLGKNKKIYEGKYRQVLEDESYKLFASKVPSLYMFDEHEVTNDFSGAYHPYYPEAMSAWKEYVGNTNPVTHDGKIYFNFTYGNVGNFFLDVRTYRDEDKKIMLGEEQKETLKKWLVNDPSIIKFIVTPVCFSHNIIHPDTWYKFRRERDEIRSFIDTNEIKGVTFLSADLHVTSVIEVLHGVYEVTTSPINAFLMPAILAYTFEDEDKIIYYTEKAKTFSKITVNTKSPDNAYWEIEIINNNILEYKAKFTLKEGRFAVQVLLDKSE